MGVRVLGAVGSQGGVWFKYDPQGGMFGICNGMGCVGICGVTPVRGALVCNNKKEVSGCGHQHTASCVVFRGDVQLRLSIRIGILDAYLSIILHHQSELDAYPIQSVFNIKVKHFRETLLRHISNVKKFVVERTRHQIQHDRRVKKRQMQTQVSKIDTCKVVDNGLVVMESNGTESEVQYEISRSGNDTDANDADIIPIYEEELMVEVQLTAKCNIFAIGQQHTKQPERVDQYPEQCRFKSPMLDSSPDNQTTECSKQSLEFVNILLKKTVAQFQKEFSRMEAHCICLKLKYQNQALKSGQHGQILNETSNKAKIKKEIDVLETMNIELEHSVAKLPKEN
ncbi:hypothetical protein Tco_0431564 [Tanacetum coccineum]